jgi:hypothetical protein
LVISSAVPSLYISCFLLFPFLASGNWYILRKERANLKSNPHHNTKYHSFGRTEGLTANKLDQNMSVPRKKSLGITKAIHPFALPRTTFGFAET